MTLNIELPPELEDSLRLYSARSGQDVGAFIVQALREKIGRAGTFQDICAPFASAVAASGITDEELNDLVEECREKVWQRKPENAR